MRDIAAVSFILSTCLSVFPSVLQCFVQKKKPKVCTTGIFVLCKTISNKQIGCRQKHLSFLRHITRQRVLFDCCHPMTNSDPKYSVPFQVCLCSQRFGCRRLGYLSRNTKRDIVFQKRYPFLLFIFPVYPEPAAAIENITQQTMPQSQSALTPESLEIATATETIC